MTDKARELLEKIVAWWDDDKEFIGDFVEEIRTYLSEKQDQPKPKFDPEPVKEILHTLLGAER